MPDTVLYGFVDLRRNFAHLPFEPTMLDAQKGESLSIVTKALDQREETWVLHDLRRVGPQQLQGMKEKEGLDDGLLRKPDAPLFIRQDEQALVSLNLEDHVQVRALSHSLQAEDALAQAKEIARAIEGGAAFAKDERIGWLTARPLHACTGLQLSYVLHLPMLSMMQQIKPLMASLDAQHLFSLKPYGQADKNPGAVYVLRNLFSAYDASEKLMRAVRKMTEEISAKEIRLRQRILQQPARSVYADQVYRAYGILKYARRLTETEFLGYWSKLRLGAAVGYLPLSVEEADQLMRSTQRSSLAAIMGQGGDEHAIHFTRADVVRAALNGGQ